MTDQIENNQIDLDKYNDKQLSEKYFKYLNDGKEVANELNRMKSNKSEFRKNVREILNRYYLTSKEKRGELKNFTKSIDDSADYIVKNYEEAEAERENQSNLDYETGEVLVSFPYGTSIERIDEVMKKEARNYEIIDDGKVHINPNL